MLDAYELMLAWNGFQQMSQAVLAKASARLPLARQRVCRLWSDCLPPVHAWEGRSRLGSWKGWPGEVSCDAGC